MNHRKNLLPHLLCLLLVLGNATAQLFLERTGLDNQPVNAYSPTSGDSYSYIRGAKVFAENGFTAAFKDGYRLPGYPLFLSLFSSSNNPLLMARYAQIFLSALMILFAYLALLNILKSGIKSVLGAAMVAIWIPLYFFSPLLYAESVSLFGLSVLLYLLSKSIREESKHLFLWAIPLLTALLVYLKPNHVFLLPPILLFAFFTTPEMKLRRLGGFIFVFTCMIAPWSVFISTQNHKTILFGTTAGENMILGTGAITRILDEKEAEGNQLPVIVAGKLGIRDSGLPVRIRAQLRYSRAEQNVYYSGLAKQIWLKKPAATSLYGFSKILHGFGFSLRGIQDLILVFLFASALFSSVYLWTLRAHREWCLLFWGVLFMVSLELFIYLPDQRFKTALFDLPALLIIALGASLFGRRHQENKA